MYIHTITVSDDKVTSYFTSLAPFLLDTERHTYIQHVELIIQFRIKIDAYL